MSAKSRIVFLIFIIAVVAFFYLFISFLILPDMHKSANLNQDIKKYEEKIKNLKYLKNSLEDSQAFMRNYNTYFINLKEGLNKEEIKKLFLMYGKDIKIEEILKEDDENFLKTSYIVDMKIDSPKDFYHLISFIIENSLPLKIDYPIIFEKNGQLIDIKFTVFSYILK